MNFLKKKNKVEEMDDAPLNFPEGKPEKVKKSSNLAMIFGMVGGLVFGVYAAALFPNIVRPMVGEEELLTKQEASLMVAEARKNERSKQKSQEVAKTPSASPVSGVPTMATTSSSTAPQREMKSLDELIKPQAADASSGAQGQPQALKTLDEVGTPTTGNSLVRSDNVGVPQAVLQQITPKIDVQPLQPYDFSKVVIDIPSLTQANPSGIEVFLSFSCGYCVNGFTIMQGFKDRNPEIPVHPVFLSGGKEDALLYASYLLIASIDKNESLRFVSHVYSNRQTMSVRDIIMSYEKINPAFVPNNMLSYWRDHKDLLEKIVNESNNTAASLHVTQTPAFVINGKPVSGEINFETLKEAWARR